MKHVIAGPCAVDAWVDKDGMWPLVNWVTELKGGGFKPLTWPPSMRPPHHIEMGMQGVRQLADVARAMYGIKTVSEVTSEMKVEAMTAYVDRLQVGARNMQNFQLLERVGRAGKPVLLKRHWAASMDEVYAAVCYLYEYGAPEVIVCERGIRTALQHNFRFLLDFQFVSEWKRLNNEDIIVDCSHWIGSDRAMHMTRAEVDEHVMTAAKTAVAAGADGIYVDVHPYPSQAAVDRYQAIECKRFAEMMEVL